MNLETTIGTAITVAVVIGIALIAKKVLTKRAPEQLRELINQLVPVVILTAVVVGILVILDPDQTDKLLDATINFVPKALVAVLVIILTRSGGKIIGLFIESAMRRISPILARRVSLAISQCLLGIGVIIALDQLGVSTDIILLLVAALAFGAALAGGLAVGLGSLAISRQVAAGPLRPGPFPSRPAAQHRRHPGTVAVGRTVGHPPRGRGWIGVRGAE